MTEAGIEAVDLHGNLSQRVRERNLHKFSSGKARVVVATDVAARGIHVDGVGLVVHYDTPNDAKAYLHRSGRTARAGSSGAVVTITTVRQVDEVVRLQSRAGVESRHHDIRTAPTSLTAEALAASGEAAPPARRGGASTPRRGGGGYRGTRDRQGDRRQDRPWSSDRGPVRRSNSATARAAAGDAARPEREGRPSYRGDLRDDASRTSRGERPLTGSRRARW
jgi:superfamily II DNA/RNA helicase